MGVVETGDRNASRVSSRDGEMRARFESFDWSRTPLGARDTWPQSLRTAAGVVLASGFSTTVLWSPELVQIHNDGYIPFLGVKVRAERDEYPEQAVRAARRAA